MIQSTDTDRTTLQKTIGWAHWTMYSGWPLFSKTWKCLEILQLLGKCQGKLLFLKNKPCIHYCYWQNYECVCTVCTYNNVSITWKHALGVGKCGMGRNATKSGMSGNFTLPGEWSPCVLDSDAHGKRQFWGCAGMVWCQFGCTRWGEHRRHIVNMIESSVFAGTDLVELVWPFVNYCDKASKVIQITVRTQ